MKFATAAAILGAMTLSSSKDFSILAFSPSFTGPYTATGSSTTSDPVKWSAFVPAHRYNDNSRPKVSCEASNGSSSSSSSSSSTSLNANSEALICSISELDELLMSNSLTSKSIYSDAAVPPLTVSEYNPFSVNVEDPNEDEAQLNAERMESLSEARSDAAAILQKYKGLTGAAIIYDKLQEHGVKVVNGYSGGANLPMLDQFHLDHPRHATKLGVKPIRWITNSNESSSGHVAEGYAKTAPPGADGTRPAGVVVVTSGPGVTNVITPLQDAMCDGVPIIVLAGQAATTAPEEAFQFSAAVDLTTPCTKWSYQINSAADLPFVLDYAFFLARHGRPGPIFVDLPKDLQVQVLDDDLIEKFASAVPEKGGKLGKKGRSPAKDDEDDEGILRLVPRYEGKDGKTRVVGHVAHLGPADKGILFDLTHDEMMKNPVTDVDLGGDEGKYQLDHHPSNAIYPGSSSKEKYGDLAVGSEAVSDILDMIQEAKRPIIVAGQGCNDASDELLKLAENWNIPVATTLHGLGSFDERHPLALNMLGMHGHPTPNFMIQESDLVLCIGSRFDDRITGRVKDFVPDAKAAEVEGTGGIVHVDIRFSEKARQVQPTFFVHSTGKKFISTLNEESERTNRGVSAEDRSHWLDKMKTLQKDFPVKVPHFPTNNIDVVDKDGNSRKLLRTHMSAQSVVRELDRQLLEADHTDDCLFTTGVGIHQMVTAQFVTWTKPRQMVTSGSLGTMGVALGYVVGCKLANGEMTCIAIDGDGSFNMTFTELKTVAEENIPIKILILDNEGQMMVEYWQKIFHDERYLAVKNTNNPHYTKLADSFGIKSIYCDAQEDLPAAIQRFLFEDNDKPVVMHARIESTPCLPLVAPGKPLQDMILDDTSNTEIDKSAAPS